jgi:hypothetical protein
LANIATTDEQKINVFKLYLKSNSPAEEWYNDVKTPKKTWFELKQGFKIKFLNIKKATKTAPELERKLGAMRISTEELGKMEKYRREDVYTHMIFVKKILDLAKQAKIETSTSSLWSVHDKLPEVLREKIPESQASWTAFAQAIKDINLGHIYESVQKYKEKAAYDAQVKADINFLKQCTASTAIGSFNLPTKAIRTQLASTAISQQPASQFGPGDPFSGLGGGGGGNLFNTKPAWPPATEAEKATVRASLALYLIHKKAKPYTLNNFKPGDICINGDNQVSKSTGFPLCPGGAPPASGECYGCG